MNFKSHQGYDNKWKEKYLQLLHEQKINFKKTRANEELFCKTVIRLILAAKGLNKQLDPYLDRINQLITCGLTNEQLRADIDALASAIKRFDRNKPVAKETEGSLLFDYLIKLYTDKATIQAIKSIQQKYLRDEFNTHDDLFAALLDATETTHSEAFLSQTGATDASHYIDAEVLSSHLILLLDNLIIPFEFEEKVIQLKARLQEHRSPLSFKPLLDDFVTLLVNVKKQAQSQQKDIENFLSQITEQLTELGLQASGAEIAAHQSDLNRKKLDQFVSFQMQELQISSDNAMTLEHLKQLISSHLDSIARQLYQHRINEEKERLQVQRQLNEMSAKIKQMESESCDLKSKLAMAYDKALRDPLTGLANRIAYDERIDSEVSRWQRYRSPLSLVICDIDNFKNINDTFGHKAGDKTLKIIAQILTQSCRRLDFLSRFGGEEFTLLLPDTDRESALNFANKLRLIIEKSRFNYGTKSVVITISCGVSEFCKDDTPETVFERADRALYLAKSSGRNRCFPG